jgi:3-dehydroquinate synthase
MIEELHDNPQENNLMRCVDFGHTFGPLVEMESIENKDFSPIPHGFVVGVDCLITSIISYERKILPLESYKKVFNLAKIINFNKEHGLFQNVDLMWSSLIEMVKHRGGKQNIPIPSDIGSYQFIQDVKYEELKNASNKLLTINEKL